MPNRVAHFMAQPGGSSKRKDDGTFVGKRKTRGHNKPRDFVIDGATVTLVGLGQACDQLGVSKKALRRYETEDVVPTNHLFDEQGRRWYHPKFIEFLAPLLVEQAKKREPLWKLRTRVEQAWQAAVGEGRIPILRPEHQETE